MLAFLLAQATVTAPAAPVGAPSNDGRVLGHFAYGDVAPGDLASLPPDMAVHSCRVRREVLPDLQRLIAAAAADPAAGGRILALSCHRSIARQSSVFATGGEGDAEARAISVAPPGHSEHTTGFAVDFAVRPSGDCPDIEACMAALPPARWLLANATRFGFELSFPPGNAQRVKWEPWHWRWVGTGAAVPGAARARFLFAKARAAFPANPGIRPPPVIVLTGQPSPPVIAPPVVEKRKKRRR
jgi:D-alanyl-D-alanine carboxypeptidase